MYHKNNSKNSYIYIKIKAYALVLYVCMQYYNIPWVSNSTILLPREPTPLPRTISYPCRPWTSLTSIFILHNLVACLQSTLSPGRKKKTEEVEKNTLDIEILVITGPSHMQTSAEKQMIAQACNTDSSCSVVQDIPCTKCGILQTQ